MPAPFATTPSSQLVWFDRACAAVSFAAPFAVAVSHANSASDWRDDIWLLRGFAGVGLEFAGAVSAFLATLSYLFPFGSLYFRMGLMGALVLGACGLAVYRLAAAVLARRALAIALAPVLAVISALLATLSFAGQTEGSFLGGAGVALLLGVIAWQKAMDGALEDPRRAVWLGVAFGALAAESCLAAIVVVAAVGASSALDTRRARRQAVIFALGAAVFTALLLLAPLYLRRVAPAPFLSLAGSLGALRAAVGPPVVRPFGGVIARFLEDGIPLLGLGAAGVVIGLSRRSSRAALLPLLVLVLGYLVSMLGEGRFVGAEDVARLRLLAIGALAVGAAVCVETIASMLLAWGLPMAKSAVILLVMAELTLAVAGAEETSFLADRSDAQGADALTDETWALLPKGAVVLVRSRRTAWRFWAARLAEGARPDVIVVPISVAGEGRLAMSLLRAEPLLQKVLYDIVLEGRPGEEALTVLADARPLFVELDPAWDRRVLSHLVPDSGWLRFTPEPRGASDRKAAYVELRARAARVLHASSDPDKRDIATLDMMRARLVDAAALAALLGDREEAGLLAAQIGMLPGGELFAAELTQKLSTTKSGPVEMKGSLR